VYWKDCFATFLAASGATRPFDSVHVQCTREGQATTPLSPSPLTSDGCFTSISRNDRSPRESTFSPSCKSPFRYTAPGAFLASVPACVVGKGQGQVTVILVARQATVEDDSFSLRCRHRHHPRNERVRAWSRAASQNACLNSLGPFPLGRTARCQHAASNRIRCGGWCPWLPLATSQLEQPSVSLLPSLHACLGSYPTTWRSRNAAS
jgi:hypothetical protein